MKRNLLQVGNVGIANRDYRLDVYRIASDIVDDLDLNINTRDDYLYRIGLFAEFMIANGGLNNVALYREYKRYLGSRNDYTVATKNKYLVGARVFCKGLHRLGLIKIDITQGIKSFKESKKHKRDGLTVCEVEAVFEYLGKIKTIEAIRAKAIIALLALQGLRQIEVVRLDVRDIDFISNIAMVKGKGADDKEAIYLNPFVVSAIKEYMKASNIKSGALFISKSNNSRFCRLSTRAIRGIVAVVFENVGINKNAHGFRHYFTTELIKTYKGDLTLVSNYTRHKSLETLQIYNDAVITKDDLPRFFGVFSNITNINI